MPRRLMTIASVAGVAAVHAGVFLSLWGSAFARFEAIPRERTPAALTVAISVLGFPLMWLDEGWVPGLRPLLGDTALVFVISGLNSTLWGMVLVLGWKRWRATTRTAVHG
jgi:hypothetical protein